MEIGKIYTFKLNSGEELIAKLQGITRDHYIIGNPVSVAPSQKGIGLVPSMFTADTDSKILLNINSVSISADTESSICDKYIEITTGIVLPEKKIVMG